ncbi:Tat pathway signal sequence domain protein [Streptomyces sp. IB2014 016-6]|uniref:Tat pathway signal sequence domain protein n=1 Tax=Streptomyces sp. IB2014 016-6 TaxID=2517818 RepID=UPI0011C71462|nr:Tat pathway signal sequence domain protein [Streptomyces sp. IB2014 016-6]TXL93069.1 Tat pathway signal sequence domain protein [Streptomyces sp. IB2014 016-6]
MSGIGPVEPGEYTYHHPQAPLAAATPVPVRLTVPPRHRRKAALGAAATLTAGVCVYALNAPEPPPAPPPPWPSQVVGFNYAGASAEADRPGAFTFDIDISTEPGRRVTIDAVTQPSAALAVSTLPSAPFTVEPGGSREVQVTVYVLDCGEVPRNAGLPFLDVTLRNERAVQKQSRILGGGYPEDLGAAIEKACDRPAP